MKSNDLKLKNLITNIILEVSSEYNNFFNKSFDDLYAVDQKVVLKYLPKFKKLIK
jgi:hypothetical protein